MLKPDEILTDEEFRVKLIIDEMENSIDSRLREFPWNSSHYCTIDFPSISCSLVAKRLIQLIQRYNYHGWYIAQDKLPPNTFKEQGITGYTFYFAKKKENLPAQNRWAENEQKHKPQYPRHKHHDYEKPVSPIFENSRWYRKHTPWYSLNN